MSAACAEAVEHDVGAVLGQGPGDAQADARRGTGDDGGLSLKHLKYLADQEPASGARLKARHGRLRVKVALVIVALQQEIAAAR